jgi:YVTN family beta-propeller protein
MGRLGQTLCTVTRSGGGAPAITVIDGATNTVIATVGAGTHPWAVAANPVTNKIYVSTELTNNVTVINGATNTRCTVAARTSHFALAVNPVTNKKLIYH